MTNVSIYGKNWIDLVFEGRNKSYGAYQLRQQNERTTITAFFYAILLFVGISGIGMILSSFGEKTISTIPTIDDDTLFLTPVTLPNRQEPKKVVIPISKKTEPEVNKKTLLDPTVVKSPDNPDDIKTNLENQTHSDAGNVGPTTGTENTDVPTGTNMGTATIITPPIPDNTPVGTNVLDKLPEFPGGIKKFYEFVGRNFNPEVELSQKINVLMYFVIEKDGSMTDIKVLRNPGYGLDKEAIRVLKSLKTKWTPGIKDGKPMRTAYTLPIAIQPQQ